MVHRSAKPCLVEGCEGYVWSRGYCAAHYTKFKKAGKLEPVRPRGTPEERFHNHYIVNQTTGCWEWTGSFHYEYAVHSDERGRTIRANRFSYETFVGKIPDRHGVLHDCDTPACVRPSHLFTGPAKVNTDDCMSKGRMACQNGKTKLKVTPPMAMNIRVLYARGYSIQTLSEIYLLSITTVKGIVKGRSHL
jgi:HNH endonuclease